MSRSALEDVRTESRAAEDRPARGASPADRDGFSPDRGLTLPRGDAREPVRVQDRTYELRGSETRLLATVGAFRVIPAADLEGRGSGRDIWHGDIRRLTEHGLLSHTRVVINGRATAVVALTREGKAVLDTNQSGRDGQARQEFHAGLVKPRELGHDAQLYRLFQAEAGRIEQDGGRVLRVVLDYELKREYQTYLNRESGSNPVDRAADLAAFADAHTLPIVDGHLELPDLRIEYEDEDGRLEVRDVELVTEHYSRGQLAGKATAGFTLYRSAGTGRGASSRTGGTPFDPGYLERLT